VYIQPCFAKQLQPEQGLTGELNKLSIYIMKKLNENSMVAIEGGREGCGARVAGAFLLGLFGGGLLTGMLAAGIVGIMDCVVNR